MIDNEPNLANVLASTLNNLEDDENWNTISVFPFDSVKPINSTSIANLRAQVPLEVRRHSRKSFQGSDPEMLSLQRSALSNALI